MTYESIADLIYIGLQDEYDDPLKEMINISEELDDNELSRAIKNKIGDVSKTYCKCPDCGCDLDTIPHKEVHNELDSRECEVFYTYECECGYRSEC